ncbi:MAG TPA: winged helix-turn-helix domain-containing protein [Povalibacter sp.]|nr:winged helix-turn-helix domain-containing protein [Povalibacter sp.]
MNQLVSFGPYRFEPQTARLWSDAAEIRLTPKAAAVLGLLVGRAGQPVTKQELFASVWSNTVVSDDALVTCIQELRKALGDDAKQPRYIETRHRSGYQFVAALAPQTPVAVATDEVAAIAVLPFVDMSPGRDQDYFCEGLAEELIDALTHVEGLRVAARSSSFQFRGAGLDIREVGRSLGVDALVEGSVRKAGDRVRVTVQLVEVASGYHKWSRRFDRELGDVFAIQEQIAENIATTLRGGDLSGRERHGLRRLHTAAAPYEYFLRGRQLLHRLYQPDLEQAGHMFERAIELDAGYAPAWAGLATVHALRFEWWGASDDDLAQADRASRTAMELAPELADAHMARGFTLSQYRRHDEAELHFEAATRINPNLFDAYYYYARMCFARGAVERSADLFRKAADVRQEDFQSPMLLAQSLRMLGRTGEARMANRESIARAERILALNPRDVRALSLIAGSLYEDGQVERAMEWSRRSLEFYPDDMGAIINAACLHAKARQKEQALELLERALGRGWGKRDWIEHDPDYDILRDEPRFQALLANLK